jgi:hypothetical protein
VEIDLFQDGGQIKIKMNVDHHSSHYPLPLNLNSVCAELNCAFMRILSKREMIVASLIFGQLTNFQIFCNNILVRYNYP